MSLPNEDPMMLNFPMDMFDMDDGIDGVVGDDINSTDNLSSSSKNNREKDNEEDESNEEEEDVFESLEIKRQTLQSNSTRPSSSQVDNDNNYNVSNYNKRKRKKLQIKLKKIKLEDYSDDNDDAGGGAVVEQVKRKKKTTRRLKLSRTEIVVPKKRSFFENNNDQQQEQDDPLEFYSEYYEKDELQIKQGKQRRRQQYEQAKLKLVSFEKMERERIETIMKQKFSEYASKITTQIKNFRTNLMAKQEIQRNQLLDMHKKELENMKRSSQYMYKLLQDRQMQERAALKNNNQKRGGGSSSAAAASALQELQNKHNNECQKLILEDNERKKKMFDAYQQKKVALHEHHERRQRELGNEVVNLQTKVQMDRSQQRALLIKAMEDKLDNLRKGILTGFNDVIEDYSQTNDESKNTINTEQNINNDDNFQQGEVDGFKKTTFNEAFNCGDAALQRQKRRRQVMNGLPVQVEVEIHNEGVFLKRAPEPKATGSNTKDTSISPMLEAEKSEDGQLKSKLEIGEFIPWGVRARNCLFSVLCGEIPDDHYVDSAVENIFDIIPSNDSKNSCLFLNIDQRCLIKCKVTDLRVSETTAQNQRAALIKDVKNKKEKLKVEAQMDILRSKSMEFNLKASQYESLSKQIQDEKDILTQKARSARSEVEAAQNMLDQFKHKMFTYLGSKAIQNEEARRELDKSLFAAEDHLLKCQQRMRQSSAALVDMHTKSMETKQKIKEQKEAGVMAGAALNRTVQKYNDYAFDSIQGNTARSNDLLSFNMEDIHFMLDNLFPLRRNQLNLKKTNIPFPDELKKTLWQKMQKRRFQIFLRPSTERLMTQLLGFCSKEGNEDLRIQMEQKLLVSLYPDDQKKSLSSVPLTRNIAGIQFAEPGWFVNLDVPRSKTHGILPHKIENPVFDKYWREVVAAPGRQSASVFKARQLVSLESPLMPLLQATSPAEVTLYNENNGVDEEFFFFDPLAEQTEKDLALCYNAIAKQLKGLPSTGTDEKHKDSRRNSKLSRPVPSQIAPNLMGSAEIKPTAQSSLNDTYKRDEIPSKMSPMSGEALIRTQSHQNQFLRDLFLRQQKYVQHQNLNQQKPQLPPGTVTNANQVLIPSPGVDQDNRFHFQQPQISSRPSIVAAGIEYNKQTNQSTMHAAHNVALLPTRRSTSAVSAASAHSSHDGSKHSSQHLQQHQLNAGLPISSAHSKITQDFLLRMQRQSPLVQHHQTQKHQYQHPQYLQRQPQHNQQQNSYSNNFDLRATNPSAPAPPPPLPAPASEPVPAPSAFNAKPELTESELNDPFLLLLDGDISL